MMQPLPSPPLFASSPQSAPNNTPKEKTPDSAASDFGRDLVATLRARAESRRGDGLNEVGRTIDGGDESEATDELDAFISVESEDIEGSGDLGFGEDTSAEDVSVLNVRDSLLAAIQRARPALAMPAAPAETAPAAISFAKDGAALPSSTPRVIPLEMDTVTLGAVRVLDVAVAEAVESDADQYITRGNNAESTRLLDASPSPITKQYPVVPGGAALADTAEGVEVKTITIVPAEATGPRGGEPEGRARAGAATALPNPTVEAVMQGFEASSQGQKQGSGQGAPGNPFLAPATVPRLENAAVSLRPTLPAPTGSADIPPPRPSSVLMEITPEGHEDPVVVRVRVFGDAVSARIVRADAAVAQALLDGQSDLFRHLQQHGFRELQMRGPLEVGGAADTRPQGGGSEGRFADGRPSGGGGSDRNDSRRQQPPEERGLYSSQSAGQSHFLTDMTEALIS